MCGGEFVFGHSLSGPTQAGYLGVTPPKTIARSSQCGQNGRDLKELRLVLSTEGAMAEDV